MILFLCKYSMQIGKKQYSDMVLKQLLKYIVMTAFTPCLKGCRNTCVDIATVNSLSESPK